MLWNAFSFSRRVLLLYLHQEIQLKTALVEFLKRYHPEDEENLKMVALGFDMHYEIAQEYEASATSSMKNITEKIRGMLLAFCNH